MSSSTLRRNMKAKKRLAAERMCHTCMVSCIIIMMMKKMIVMSVTTMMMTIE